MNLKRSGLLRAAMMAFGLHANLPASAAINDSIREKVTIRAEVVALEQPILYNRFGSHNPHGMLFALAEDVVESALTDPDRCNGSEERAISPTTQPGRLRLRCDKRPRPLVLRLNVGDVLEVRFRNMLPADRPAEPCRRAENLPGTDSTDWPVTVCAGLSVVGLSLPEERPAADSMVSSARLGACVEPGGEAADPRLTGMHSQRPGECRVYRFEGLRPGSHLMLSHAAPAGGEGDGGALTHGLFGVVVVEPEGTRWYRSQVSAVDFAAARPAGQSDALLDYEATRNGRPLLSLTRSSGERLGDRPVLDLAHGDLNAILYCPLEERQRAAQNPPDWKPTPFHCATLAMRQAAVQPPATPEPPWDSWRTAPAEREFVAVFHDELKTRYLGDFRHLDPEFRCRAWGGTECDGEAEPHGAMLDGIGDGFAINYGASGMGTILLANRLGIGPAATCTECDYEEFFLQSWANGDPALLTEEIRGLPAEAWARRPRVAPDAAEERVQRSVRRGARPYADDPANTHHAYIGDRVAFRNLHAGPKETHVFHLHAHQWRAGSEGSGAYRDSQTIAPLQAFSYEIDHGGGGNLNLSPGDAIFHCHLYPHFAQGMWSLWRNHDVLEDGTRTLPDGVLGNGTNPLDGSRRPGAPIPAVVPLPGQAAPPVPDYANGLTGYPFFMPGEAGHRVPQPPLDIAESGGVDRHRIIGGARPNTKEAQRELKLGVHAADLRRFRGGTGTPLDLVLLPQKGTELERRAMAFHAGQAIPDEVAPPGQPPASVPESSWVPKVQGFDKTEVTSSNSGVWWRAYELPLPEGGGRGPFRVNGRLPQYGAPFADPCRIHNKDPDTPVLPRRYDVSAVQLDLLVNDAGWHDPQAQINVLTEQAEAIERRRMRAAPFFFRAHSGECIEFRHQNRTEGELRLDDFQVATTTDTIGQHIHLVKFDVLASDGSANGWNYEDGTFARSALVHRVERTRLPGGSVQRQARDGTLSPASLPAPDDIGFQTTIQRWYADPVWHSPLRSAQPGGWCDRSGRYRPSAPPVECDDTTLRTVFTHDHFGPSSIQQHGFYSALLVEPSGSRWFTARGEPMCWDRDKMNQPQRQRGDCVMPVTQLFPPPGVTADAAAMYPTAQAMILVGDGTGDPDTATHSDHREFPLAIADFALLYSDTPARAKAEDGNHISTRIKDRNAKRHLREWRTKHGWPVAPPPAPEAISQHHHDPYLVNYRHEPLALRLGRHSQQLEQSVRGGVRWPSSDPGGSFAFRLGCTWLRPDARDTASRQRQGNAGEVSLAYSSLCHGDPGTELFEAYEGEALQFRLIQGAQEVQHVFNVHGLRWRRDMDSLYGGGNTIGAAVRSEAQPRAPGEGRGGNRTTLTSRFVAAQEIGISEHFEFETRSSNVTNPLGASDHLWHFGSSDAQWNGAWGLLRIHNGTINANQDRWERLNEQPQGQASVKATPDATACLRQAALAARGRAADGLDCAESAVRMRLASLRALRNLSGSEATALARQATGEWKAQSPRVHFPHQAPSGRLIAPLNACPAEVAWAEPASGKWSLRPIQVRRYEVVARSVEGPGGLVYRAGTNGPSLTDPRAMRFVATRMWTRTGLNMPPGREVTLTQHNGPLVLRALAGECIEIVLRNELNPASPWFTGQPGRGEARQPNIVTLNVAPGESDRDLQHVLRPSRRISLRPQLVEQNPLHDGVDVGVNLREPVDRRNQGVRPDWWGLSRRGADDDKHWGMADIGQSTFYAWFAGRSITLPPAPKGSDECAAPTDMLLKERCEQNERAAAQRPFVVVGFAEDYGPVNLVSGGDPFFQPAHGLVGALVVMRADACLADTPPAPDANCPDTPDRWVSSAARVQVLDDREQKSARGWRSYRDHVLLYRDGLNLQFGGRLVPDCKICDDSYDHGDKAVDERAEPLWARLNVTPPRQRPDGKPWGPWTDLNIRLFRPDFWQSPPATPRISGQAGEELRLHVLHPAGRARQRAFTVLGHNFQALPLDEQRQIGRRLMSRFGERQARGAVPLTREEQEDDLRAAIGWYGSPGVSLLGPGRAVEAVIPSPREGRWLWRDGPAMMFSSGVWGWMDIAPAEAAGPRRTPPGPVTSR